MISQFVYSGDDSLQSISLLGAMALLDAVSVKLGLKQQIKNQTLQSVPNGKEHIGYILYG